jgi:hypothetical protein
MKPKLSWIAGLCAAALLLWLPLRSQPPGRVDANGIAVTPGPGWQLNRAVLDSGGPVAFTNFGGAYIRGGILPPGGAEIDLTSQPLPQNTAITQVIGKEQVGARMGSLREMSVAGISGYRFTYVDTFTPSLEYETVAVYVGRGQTVHKFFLTYRNGDPGAAAFTSSFDQMIAGLRFTR